MFDLLKKVTDKIHNLGIDYMLSGSVAIGFYTIQRTTRDIDIVVDLKANDIPKIQKTFENDFYCYEPSIQDAFNNQSIFNMIDNETGFKIDFIVRKKNLYADTAFGRAIWFDWYDTKIRVISVEDLILAKLIWIQELQSERQIEDIKNLLESPQKIDTIYLNLWIKNLNILTFNINF